MDKYKIKDLAERLQKENTTELKNKMLFMWIKQEVISLKEYNELVKLILYDVVGQSEQLVCPNCKSKNLEVDNSDIPNWCKDCGCEWVN